MVFLAAVLIICLACFDAWFTVHKRVKRYGIGIEMNPLIRFYAGRWGDPVEAVWVGVLIPTLLLTGLFLAVPPLLYILLGMRLTLFLFQVRNGK